MRTVITNLAVMVVGVALFFSTLGEVSQTQPYVVMGLTPTAEPPTPTAEPPTNTPEPTAAPTNTPVPTTAPTNTPEPTVAPTNTPMPTATPTNTPVPTAVPTATSAPLPPREKDEPTPVVEQSDPALDKRVSPAEAKVGDIVEYTLTATNLGATPALNVVVEDPLPAFLELVQANASRGQVSSSGATVRVVIGELAADERVQITIVARITQAAASPQNLNRATLSTSSRTDIVSNNTSAAAITINETTATTATTATPTVEPAMPTTTAEPTVDPAMPTTTAEPVSTPIPAAPTTPSNNQQVSQPVREAPQEQAKPVENKPTSPVSRPSAILSRTGTNGLQQVPLLFVLALTILALGSGTLVKLCLILRRSRR